MVDRRGGRAAVLLFLLLVGLLLSATSGSADTVIPCLTCSPPKPVVKPVNGAFAGVLLVPGPHGSARPIGGDPSGDSAPCDGCFSEILPTCGDEGMLCTSPVIDACIRTGGASYYVLFHRPPAAPVFAGEFCVQPGQRPVPIETVTGQVRAYLDELVPHDPQVAVQPPGGSLVHVPTLVRAAMTSDAITKDFFTPSGFAVTVTAKPVRWTWTFGEGEPQPYGFPGKAYDGRDPSRTGEHVTHTYETAGSRPVQVTVAWTASYVLTGVGTVDAGEVDRPSDPVAVVVKTARSELVSGR